MLKRFCNFLCYLAMVGLLASACTATPAPNATSTPKAVISTPKPQPVFPTSTTTPVPAGPTATPLPSPEGLWSYQTQGSIWGTPSASDSTVYFGSDDGSLYAADAKNGSLKWKFTSQGIVRSQPAIAGGLVYFSSDDGYLYAVDAQKGTQVWHTDIGNVLAREAREKLGTNTSPSGWDYKQSSPVVVGGQVYVGSLDGNIYSLAADSGHIAWKYQTGGKVRATPIVGNGILFVGSWDGYVYALDAHTGLLSWKSKIGGEIQSTAVVGDGLVYTASRKASVVALDINTGDIKWEYPYGSNLWVESSPILVNGIIYIGSSGNWIVLGLDSQTGKQSTLYFANAWHWSTPTILNNILYIGGTRFKTDNPTGGLYGLKLVNGNFIDRSQAQLFFPSNQTLETEGNWAGVASSPIIMDGIIYFGGLDGKLYAVKSQ